ncbi:MAG: hypothetical protein AB1921_11610 [Thermodesulfobacteriota bacterium]
MNRNTGRQAFGLASIFRSFAEALFSDRKKPSSRTREKGVVYVPITRASSARNMPVHAGEKA